MADEQNTLRQAIDRILGTSPGGGTGSSGGWGTGGKAPQESAVQMPVRDATSDISAKLETPTAYDPMAESQAAFDKQMAELKAWTPAGATTAAAAAPAEDTTNKGYGISYSYPNSGIGTPTYKVLAQGASPDAKGHYSDDQWITLSDKNVNDPWVQESMKGGLTNLQNTTAKTPTSSGAYGSQNTAINAWTNLIANPGLLSSPAYKSTGSTGISKPKYPGGGGQGVDWRTTAQYWKDLEAYNRSMGLPINQR